MATATTSAVLGRHVWSELMTTDVKGAQAFYDKVIGWTSAQSSNSPGEYIEFKRSGGSSVAGLLERPKDMPMSIWAMYIAVPHLEDAAEQIEDAGGAAVSDIITVPTVGRMQMVKDPQGAGLYIIQLESTEMPPDRDPEVGEASWLELMTTDAPAAMTFYQELFGWQPSEAMDMGPDGKYQMFNRGSRMIGGMMKKPAQLAQVPPFWTIYFRVDNIDAAVDRLKAGGGTVTNGPLEVPGGDKIVNAVDPQGAGFSLHARKPA